MLLELEFSVCDEELAADEVFATDEELAANEELAIDEELVAGGFVADDEFAVAEEVADAELCAAEELGVMLLLDGSSGLFAEVPLSQLDQKKLVSARAIFFQCL